MEAYARLLGVPQLSFASASYEPPLTKATALLYYLAFKGEWCSRDELIYLFYPDSPESVGRGNLRQRLVSIKRLPYSEGLEIAPARLRWSIATDVQAFKQAVQERNDAKAIALYRGQLLGSASLPDVPEFESWLELQREELHSQWRDAVFAYAQENPPDEAAGLLQLLLKHDPLDEEALRAYMRAAAQAGQRSAALKAYRSFRDNLKAELDLAPTSVTQQLADAIEAGEVQPVRQPALQHTRIWTGAGDGGATPAATLPPLLLPGLTTSFVGREAELQEVLACLQREDCRLVTIVGPGGIGKTRLAVQAMKALTSSYPGGCHFVLLDALSRPEGVPLAIAGALGLELQGQEEPLEQVTRAIGNKTLLLALDNYEHLLDAATLPSLLLQRCPRLKLLVTSRERLNLAEEWLFALHGLALPDPEQSRDEALKADAVSLFLQRAKQVSPAFTPADDDLEHIIDLCRLVEGSPLALELSAVWVRVMSSGEIVAELTRNIDFLTASARNIPERHKSLRATFEHSWKLLTPLEQDVLRKLAAFRGGFTRGAASVVVEAPTAVLASLLDKSLLRLTPNGRYDRHPLVYQFAEEKLSERPLDEARVKDRHARYFLNFLQRRENALLGRQQQRAMDEIALEMENLQRAWRRALLEAKDEALEQALRALHRFFDIRCRFSEGEALFKDALEALGESAQAPPARRRLVAKLLSRRGSLLHRLAQPDQAVQHLQRGLEICRELDDQREIGFILNSLGIVSYVQGDYEEAKAYCEASVAVCRLGDYPWDLARALNSLNFIAYLQGEFAKAEALCRESLEIRQRLGDARGSAICINHLGNIAHAQGRYAKARGYYGRSLARFEELGDRWGMAVCLNDMGLMAHELGELGEAEALQQRSHALGAAIGDKRATGRALTGLGLVAQARGERDKAQALQAQALAGFEAIGDKLGMAASLHYLGRVHFDLGDSKKARACYFRSLKLSWRIQALPHTTRLLVDIAELHVKQQKKAQAVTLLKLVLAQDGATKRSKDLAAALLARLETGAAGSS